MQGAHAPRRIAVGALAMMLAVLVAGVATMPAHATDNSRRDTVNAYISDCFSSGGDPEVYIDEATGDITVFCFYDEGTTFCVYPESGGTRCYHTQDSSQPPPHRWDLPPLMAGTNIDHWSSLQALETDRSTKRDHESSLTTHAGDQKQDGTANTHGKSTHKHGKHGKKGGKRHN